MYTAEFLIFQIKNLSGQLIITNPLYSIFQTVGLFKKYSKLSKYIILVISQLLPDDNVVTGTDIKSPTIFCTHEIKIKTTKAVKC